MSLLLNLSIIGTILTFLVGILISFPGQTSEIEQNATTQEEEQFDVDQVHDVAELFAGGYVSVIDDISSHQSDPNFERAENKRKELTAYGNSLIGDFKGLEQMLTEQLDQIEVPETELETESTPTP